MEKVKIKTEFITLGQLLKLVHIAMSGGAAKVFLSETSIFVNQEPENRRGKKLRPGDVIEIVGHGTFEIQ